MVSQVTGSAVFSAAMLSGSQCRGPRDTQSQQADKTALQEKLFGKLDVNGDGGVDETELNDFLSFAASSTGSTSSSSSADLFKSLDADGDGSVSKTELSDGAKSLFDELRTQLMSSSSQATESSETKPAEKPDEQELFAQIDTNGDGSIDQDELGTFFEQARPQGPPPPGGPPGGQGGGGMFSRIESLLDQYRSTASATADSTTTETVTSTLSIAA